MDRPGDRGRGGGFLCAPAPRHLRRPRQPPDHQWHGRRHQALQSQAFEVYGPPGTTANINYLDITAQPRRVDNTAQPRRVDNVPLPWTLSVTTTLPSVSVNVVAQGNSNEIGCRIVVNDVVKDERTSDGVNAETFCIVKSG